MVRIYYHIYATDGVESIIDEQISLIEKHFNFPYILNVGISIANKNESTYSIIEKFSKTNYHIRDVRANGNEFTTLDLIEIDKDKFDGTLEFPRWVLCKTCKGSGKDMNNKFAIKNDKGEVKYFEADDGCDFCEGTGKAWNPLRRLIKGSTPRNKKSCASCVMSMRRLSVIITQRS